MELRQLEYFVAVVEEASFTRAAARVRVAQPGVSAQIRQLEHELGQPLLDRSGRTVRLTEVGAAVLPHARAALAAVRGVRFAVEELTGLVRGSVAVGMITACAFEELPTILAAFHRKHPAVEVRLSEANSDALLEALQAGELDLALVGLASPPPEGIETHVLVDEMLMAAVAPGHSLAGKTSLSLDALREHALISLPRGTGLRTCIELACAGAGFEPRVALEASNPNIVAQLAARGLGMAILPDSVARAHARQLVPIPIHRPRLRSRVEFAWRAAGAQSPAARALVSLARATLAARPRPESSAR